MATALQDQVADQLTEQADTLSSYAYTPGLDPAVKTQALDNAGDMYKRAASILALKLANDTSNMQNAISPINNANAALTKLIARAGSLNHLTNTVVNYLKYVDAFIAIAKAAAGAV